jgi:hypothetical protein
MMNIALNAANRISSLDVLLYCKLRRYILDFSRRTLRLNLRRNFFGDLNNFFYFFFLIVILCVVKYKCYYL